MSFSSLSFYIFFLLVLCLIGFTNLSLFQKHFNTNIKQIRHIILLIFSYIFYGWWDWRFCGLLFLVTLISYYSAKMQDRISYKIGILMLLLILGVFKYYNFFLDSFCYIFNITQRNTIYFILPVGISFYVFQAISYIFDVKNNLVSARKSFISVALYISFFPQLVAGPIVKAKEFFYQLDENRTTSIQNIKLGIQIFIIGLFKKIVLADHLSLYVDEVFSNPNAYSCITIVLSVISYSFQIYFDFSGYSDMAIGCAKCLGYDLPKNFNLPYISKNVSEFWKRWHISLSSWLQQYLYIPLGGNRKGKFRTYVNLLLTMILGGLWHGANWTFVIWGFLNGIALCVHKFFSSYFKSKKNSKILTVISIFMTFIFVSFCWIFFRSQNIASALLILNRIILHKSGVIHIYSYTFFSIIFFVTELLVCMHNSLLSKKHYSEYLILNLDTIPELVYFFTLIGLTFGLAYAESNPFIYFAF